MKFNHRLKLVILLVTFYTASGQIANPSAGAAVKFDSYPIDLSTGMPDISIPLYSLPTRSKDVTVNFNLRYHPSSVSKFGRRMGNCGSGWSFSPGGVITKTSSSLPGIFYDFSFMGISGKFQKQGLLPDGHPIAKVTESNGMKPVIEPVYTLSNSKYIVEGYIIYDDLGYKYKFLEKDIIYEPNPVNDDLITVENTFHLSEIYDNNNNLLVRFNYSEYTEQVRYNGQMKVNHFNTLNKIIVPGYGNVDFTINNYYERESESAGLWITYTTMVVKDFKGNTIQEFDFNHDSHYDSDGNFIIALAEINQYVGTSSTPFTYKFFYKPLPYLDHVSPYVGGYDDFGYYSVVNKDCDTPLVDPKYSTSGILEKMQLPTGGCIIYNYEANRYSFGDGTPMDIINNDVNNIDLNFYYHLEYWNISPSNLHNYNRDIIGILPPSDTSMSFSLTQATRVFFKFNGNGKITPGLEGGASYPDFKLLRKRNGLPDEVIETFDQNYVDGGYLDSPWGNCNNFSLGRFYDLNQGEYSIQTSGGILPYAEAYTLTPKPIEKLERWWYGGGNRIKAIAYFSGSNIPQNYFDLDPQVHHLQAPTKLTTYKYDLFKDSKYSSGFNNASIDDQWRPFVRYSNVTVYEGKGQGRTEYTFFSPIDDLETDQIGGIDFRIGMLKKKEVFNEAGICQLKCDYEYFWEKGNQGTWGQTEEKMGWALPKQVVNEEIYLSGKRKTKEEFEYYDNNKLKQKTSLTSRLQSLITKYHYTDLIPNSNSIHSKNRIELDFSEQYLGTKRLSSSKVEYLNNWDDNGQTNVSYLPSEIKQSKGVGDLETKSKINRYDKYGHVLETQKPNDIKTSYIWGYDDTQIVAEVVNSAYVDIPQGLITDIQNASRSIDPIGNLLEKITNLRNSAQLQNAYITSYTYQPLVGILTKTDARGYTVSYEYDSNNRQTIVKDQEGNIISENIYHTKPQN